MIYLKNFKKRIKLQKILVFLELYSQYFFLFNRYQLCSVYNATTTGLIHNQTKSFDKNIISKLNLPEKLFVHLENPGYKVGKLLPQIQSEVGGNCDVVLCATHDTASAVEGIDMEDNQLYLSSGTWSLLGVKTKHPITTQQSLKNNYSNEGGVGYNRFQKNIMGLWLVQNLQKELCSNTSFDEICQYAEKAKTNEVINCENEVLFSPKSMVHAFDELLGHSYSDIWDYFKCAYQSLAVEYRKAIGEIENNTNTTYKKIYIVGGGAKNTYLNNLTGEITGKEVIVLSIEATAIGNLKIQFKAEGL